MSALAKIFSCSCTSAAAPVQKVAAVPKVADIYTEVPQCEAITSDEKGRLLQLFRTTISDDSCNLVILKNSKREYKLQCSIPGQSALVIDIPEYMTGYIDTLVKLLPKRTVTPL